MIKRISDDEYIFCNCHIIRDGDEWSVKGDDTKILTSSTSALACKGIADFHGRWLSGHKVEKNLEPFFEKVWGSKERNIN